MKSIIRDKCPACGYQFGFRGPSFKIPDKGSGSSKPLYFCPKCTVELYRVVSTNERIASVIGYVALLIASLVSMWKIVMGNEVFAASWLIALYSVSIIGIGTVIVFAVTRQHYVLRPSSQNDDTKESEALHD